MLADIFLIWPVIRPTCNGMYWLRTLQNDGSERFLPLSNCHVDNGELSKHHFQMKSLFQIRIYANDDLLRYTIDNKSRTSRRDG